VRQAAAGDPDLSGRLRARPDWSAEYLAGRLSDARRRLAELRAGDLDVRASLELSYRDWAPMPRGCSGCCRQRRDRRFHRLAAALAGLPEPETGDLLDQLVLSQLAEPAGPGRYQMHDLTRLASLEFFGEARSRRGGGDPVMSVLVWYIGGLAQVAGVLGQAPPVVTRVQQWLSALRDHLLEVWVEAPWSARRVSNPGHLCRPPMYHTSTDITGLLRSPRLRASRRTQGSQPGQVMHLIAARSGRLGKLAEHELIQQIAVSGSGKPASAAASRWRTSVPALPAAAGTTARHRCQSR